MRIRSCPLRHHFLLFASITKPTTLDAPPVFMCSLARVDRIHGLPRHQIKKVDHVWRTTTADQSRLGICLPLLDD